jgi:O-antigen ligase
MPRIFDIIIFGLLSVIGLVFAFLKNYFEDFKLINKILLFFWLASFVSCVVNSSFGISANIRDLIWRIISFFFVFSLGILNNKKIIENIKNILVISCFVFAIISIFTFLFQINYIFYINNFVAETNRTDPIRFGFVENRLFGIYSNPNVGSTVCFMAILFALGAMVKSQKKKFYISSIILNFIYIALSGSRVTILAMLIITCVIFFAYIKIYNKFNILMNLFLSIFACALIYFGAQAVKLIFSYVPGLISKIINISENYSKIDMNRIDIQAGGDISNLRFSIWKSGLEIFKTTWLFGTSPRNIVLYAKKILPESFIAKSQYTAMHNTYIGVFVYTGVLGAVFFYIFIVNLLNKMFKILKKFIKNIYSVSFDNQVIIFSILSILIFAMFEPEIILSNTICSLIFWSFSSRLFQNSKIRDSQDAF